MENPLRLPVPELLLRLALAFSFLYPAIHAVFDPYAWVGYFPTFVLDLLGDDIVLLHLWGAAEAFLALWVLFGRRVLVPSVLMTALLVLVVLANPGQFPILFRDLSIALAGAALAFMHHPHGSA